MYTQTASFFQNHGAIKAQAYTELAYLYLAPHFDRVVPVFHVEIDQSRLQSPFHTLSIPAILYPHVQRTYEWKNISISTKFYKSMRVLLTWLNERLVY